MTENRHGVIPGDADPNDASSHDHEALHTHSYWNGRAQTDEPCRNVKCPGIGRVQSEWAPDCNLNWLKCCCCGDRWVPGPVLYAPGEGESLRVAGLI